MKVLRMISFTVLLITAGAACSNGKDTIGSGMCAAAFKAWGFEVEECAECVLLTDIARKNHVVLKLNAMLPVPLLGLTRLSTGDDITTILMKSPLLGNYDLLKALKHEAGHALRMPHSDDPRSIMYFQASAEQADPTPMEIFLAHVANGDRKLTCEITAD